MVNGQNLPSSSLLTTSSWRRLLYWTLCNFALMKTYARQLSMELVASLTFWTRAMFVTCSRLDDPPGCQAGWALLRPPGRPLPSPGYDMCTACDPDYHCKHWCFEDFNLNTLSIPSYGSYIHVDFIKLPKAHCAIIITWWPVPGLSRRYGMLYLKYKNATAYMDLTKNNMDYTLRQWQVGTTVWRRLRPGTPATHSRANCKQMSVFDTEQDQVNYLRYLNSLLSKALIYWSVFYVLYTLSNFVLWTINWTMCTLR